MNTDQIKADIQNITLAHMAIDIDIDTMLLDDYAGAERHLSLYLVQGYYNRYKDKLGDSAKQTHLERALTHAKWFAIKRLTQDMPGLVERSTVWLLDEAKHSGWFTDMEHENISELLASMYDDQDASDSERSDYTFIVDSLLPAAKAFGLDTDAIMGASVQTKKFRGLVPHARELLKRHANELISEEKAAEDLGWMLETAADTSVSYPQMKDIMWEWEGKARQQDEPLQGYQMIVSGTHTWMLVPVATEKDRAVIESALRGRVDFRLTGIDWVLKAVKKLYKKTDLGDNDDTDK